MSPEQNRRTIGLLAALALCMGLQMTGFVMLQPLFALRFESLGAGVEALGTSSMAYALTSIAAAPIIGVLADRFGRRLIILVSLTGYVFNFIGYLLAANAWGLIVLRGIGGIFTVGILTAMTSLVGDLAPVNRRGQWIGIVNGGASIGWVAGPLLGGLLYDHFGFNVPFAAASAMAAGAWLLTLISIPETRSKDTPSSQDRLAGLLLWRSLPGRSTLALVMVISFGVMLAWAFIEPQFMFYAYDELGWVSSQLGLIMSAYGMAFMLGGFGLGQLSDRLGRKPVLIVGVALFSSQFAGLALSRQVGWIVASFILAGLGNALYEPALSAMILDITPPDQTAGMIGIKNAASSLGNLIGPGLAVLLASTVSPQAFFLMAMTLVWALTIASGVMPHTLETENRIQPSSEAAL